MDMRNNDINNFNNEITIVMDSKSQNESLSRMMVSAFLAPLDPHMTLLTDIKTAVSEAVTNAVIHGYKNMDGKITLGMTLNNGKLDIVVADTGVGISDINAAMEPLFTTTSPDMERAGMGFTVMESFMDSVKVTSVLGSGTTIEMTKDLLCDD